MLIYRMNISAKISISYVFYLYQNEVGLHCDAWKVLLKKVRIPCNIWIGFEPLFFIIIIFIFDRECLKALPSSSETPTMLIKYS